MELDISVYITIITLIVLFLIFLLALKSSKKIPNAVKRDIYKQLGDIKVNIDANLVSANRDSLVRLDSLLSKSLQLKFSNTETCGENLKSAKRLFKKSLYEDLWHYHKLRNSVVHENIDIQTATAKKALRAYSNAIAKLLQ